ncbi:hypothetical protein ACFX4S_08925 [Kosakonia sp. YIM B13605]|uniref:hypothetical protein n=1 Tax=unclassified Kosakonia TaxID=2632876 RepID=UPI0036BC6B20
MSKPTYEELEAQVKQLAAERDAVVAENTTLKLFRKSLEDIRSSLIGGGHGYMAVSDMQAQNAVLDVVFDEFDGIDTPATDGILASLRAEGVADDYFGGLVTKARASADKAMRKFPQPNYVLLKVAEEAGEVVQADVHYAENRMTWQDVEGEIIQLLAMLIRLVTEGDQVNGITPPALCQSAPSPEAAAIARQSEQVKGVQS